MLSEITNIGFRLVGLDFGFVCDEPLWHRLICNRFGTQFIISGTSSTQHIPAGMHKTYYIIPVRMQHIIF